jgi:hypothetical protein
MKYAFALLVSLIPILSTANQDLPSVKLRCSGFIWLNGQKVDLKDGFIDLNKSVAIVRGFGIPDGDYKVLPKSVREDFLAIKSVNQPSILGGINRISGSTNFSQDSVGGKVGEKQILFLGECVKAKAIF